ncbi:iron-siderophore ABC transporter substrate-binding protein [Methylomonas sp. EFPC3]|uniref:ABC transporter substrate-binding protein n=1 Tax=Methylomonas sp. EFPC3 TaxID=3021710 RepID=UPI0024172FE7|nr:iron-siderophore ABC transporter substrate-binding protein [Methylomonas sp. EFPC3]WFP50550.1 iron-siderophore ABC transporter substrate-binding protein [Methylomonas sp. EFPC3]
MKTAAAGALLALILALGACGREQQTSAPPVTAREIADAYGRKVAVPATAQRVVVLSELDLDAALALQVTPAGAVNGRGSDRPPAYLEKYTGAVASVGDFAQPSLDRIVALQPDLILAGGQSDPAMLEQLAAIAPMVVSFYPGEPWQDSLQRIAVALGRPQACEPLLQAYRARVGKLRAALSGHRGESVSIVRLTPNGPMYMLGEAFAGRVLADLDLTRPPAQRQAGAGHGPPLSREMLADIDGDWLFIGNFSPDPRGVAALRDEPAFAELRAVKTGRVREVDAALWTVVGGPVAAQAVLDDIEAAFAARGNSL